VREHALRGRRLAARVPPRALSESGRPGAVAMPPGQPERPYWIQTPVKSNRLIGLSTAPCSLAEHTVARSK
jgi:hypothetical protein